MNPVIISVFVGLIAFTNAHYYIESPQVTNWGNWGNPEQCPPDTYAQAFQLKTDSYKGRWEDDTGINGIRVYCGNPSNISTRYITSSMGQFGNWGSLFNCYPGVLTGFQLQVQGPQESYDDDTATNNVRFYCSNSGGSGYMEGDGLHFGSWTEARHCNRGDAVCGLQTQVEPYMANRGM